MPSFSEKYIDEAWNERKREETRKKNCTTELNSWCEENKRNVYNFEPRTVHELACKKYTRDAQSGGLEKDMQKGE